MNDPPKIVHRSTEPVTGKNITVPADMSYKDWYNKYVANQDLNKILDNMDGSEQKKYCGGKQKWALVKAGVITNSADIYKIRTTSLKKLNEDGIFTIKEATLEHSTKGKYKIPNKQYPSGRMVSGGHTQVAMDMCKEKGIKYEVTGMFSNGVRVGNIPSSELKIKKAGNGQAWFPESWDDEKVLIAGTAVANDGSELIDGYHKTGVYDGVAVRVLYDKGEIVTICPDLDQNIYVEGVEKINGNGKITE